MEGLKKLKKMWDENPLAVLTIAGGTLLAAAKFIDAASAVQGRRAYAKQVKMKSRS